MTAWDLWAAIKSGGEILSVLQPYAIVGTLIGTIWTGLKIWRMSRGWRMVTIVAVDQKTLARKHVAELPWQFASRAEVQGLVANGARGGRLDFSLFKYDYQYSELIVVPLPTESFDRVEAGASQHPAVA